MKIILISGKAGSGKDTAGQMLYDELTADNYTVLVTHYADLLKYICRTFFGWDGVKDDFGRSLLQHVGTEVIRSKEPDFWVRFVMDMLRFFKNEWDYVIIPDCRFPNEVEVPKEYDIGDVVSLKIERTGYDNRLTQEQKNHSSETALDNYKTDYCIDNCGTPCELREKVKLFVKEKLYAECTGIN